VKLKSSKSWSYTTGGKPDKYAKSKNCSPFPEAKQFPGKAVEKRGRSGNDKATVRFYYIKGGRPKPTCRDKGEASETHKEENTVLTPRRKPMKNRGKNNNVDKTEWG